MRAYSRHPWLAALLSLLWPGAGQLYAGRPARGVVFFFLPVILLVMVTAIGCAAPRVLFGAMVAIFVPGMLFVRLGAPIDAYRVTPESAERLSWFQRFWVYLPAGLAAYLLSVGAVMFVRHSYFEPYVSPTASMEPGLLAGDRFYVDKRPGRPPARGEMVAFRRPDGIPYIKRVVALAGDQIEVKGGRLWLNNQPVPETPGEGGLAEEHLGDHVYSVSHEPGAKVRDYAATVMPEGKMFVVGDNRDNSYDSRSYGPVDVTSVVGRPLQIWFSYDSEARAVRWRRIGHALR